MNERYSKRSYHGSNDYPPYWKELLKVFKEFAPKI